MDDPSRGQRAKSIADADLAHRSRLSALVYLSLLAIILVFTPYAQEHTASAAVIGGAILLSAVLRSWLVLRFRQLYPRNPQNWLVGFVLLTLMMAGTWGLFCAHTVLNYDIRWTAMLTLLSTAGISAGAITTLSIHRALIMAYLALLLLPPTAAATLLQSRDAYAITLMFLTYFLFMFSVANSIHKSYWRALNNALLLDLRARELEASNRELESYSYSIAHDLRAPLRSIIGFSQILKEELQDRMAPSERADLKRVINAGRHMAKLIDDILELSRITRRDLSYADTDLSAIVHGQAEALQKVDPERYIRLDIQPGVRARGDARLLALALQNLVENAWKFTRNADPAEISFRVEQRGQETVYCLCDNGAGFDMAHAGKLFKPFERLHSQREYPGTGVGLATVQRIILRHGGQVWARSSPGHGACFYFTLK